MENKNTNEYNQKLVTHPGETLLDVLEEKGMSQAELSERTGRPKKTINEIIRGKTSIKPETALQLERVLGIPAAFWNNRQRQYDEFIARKAEEKKLMEYMQWLRTIPLGEMVKYKWIANVRQRHLLLNEVLKFFGVNSPDEWSAVWKKPAVVYRQSQAFNKKPEATSAWLRKGELEAHKIDCAPYEKESFKKALQQIRSLTREKPHEFKQKLIKICASSGVAVVIVPSLKGVPVYGITKWINPEKALIQLSLRGKYEDIFWFTFFHESGHILLHGKRDVFIESEDGKDLKEKEADEFASNFLIPFTAWTEFVTQSRNFTKENVLAFAKKIEISPAIIVGRLHHEKKIPFSHLNEFRSKFENI